MKCLKHEGSETIEASAWQYDNAVRLIAGHGRIVAEYFDVGYPRSLAWTHRPQAAALLAAITSARRGSDPIVVGEYERAFYGRQLKTLMPVLQQHSPGR